MIIGLSTVLLTSNGLDSQIDFSEIKKAGINHVELSSPSHIDIETIKKIKNSSLNIYSAHSDFIDVDISSPDTYSREKSIMLIKTRVRLLSEIGAQIIVIHPGDWYENPIEKEERINNSINSLTQIALFANSLNVKVAMENLPPGFVADDIGTMKRILVETRKAANLKGNIGICLDTGHANLSNNLMDYLEHFRNDILTMHIHDNFGNNNNDPRNAGDDSHLLPGTGTIDWNKFFDNLDGSYNGGFIFELISKKDDYVSIDDEDILAILKNLKSFLNSQTWFDKDLS
ncbi:MAG: sugar phosphate isomerase/epimerase family protein [Candidatus Humimicrobiaceae bacterium]